VAVISKLKKSRFHTASVKTARSRRDGFPPNRAIAGGNGGGIKRPTLTTIYSAMGENRIGTKGRLKTLTAPDDCFPESFRKIIAVELGPPRRDLKASAASPRCR